MIAQNAGKAPTAAELDDKKWEPPNSEGYEKTIEWSENPNPSVSSFESFQETLFSQVNIRKHLEYRKLLPVRLEVPLCRLKPTSWVRQALPADVQTVYDGFHIGNWGTNFWVTCCGTPGKFPEEEFDDLERWQSVSDEFDAELEELCGSDPQNRDLYEKIIGQYVHVWDGNHRALAWMKHIKDNNGDPIKVSCFVLNDTEADRGWISNFMRDINEYVLLVYLFYMLVNSILRFFEYVVSSDISR